MVFIGNYSEMISIGYLLRRWERCRNGQRTGWWVCIFVYLLHLIYNIFNKLSVIPEEYHRILHWPTVNT